MSGAGSGGSSGSGGSGSDPSQLPSDTTATGIASFIQAGTYKSWVHDAAPRPAFSLLTHGNNMQVYFNELAVAAGVQGEPAPGGMVIKEIYGEDNVTLLGVAASIKVAAGDEWIYYCTNAGGTLCTGQTETVDPIYSNGGDNACSTCHAEVIFSKLPQ